MFRADAEDEFQILDVPEGWVHIQISGLSRGWIRRDFVDIPGAATVSLSVMRGDQNEKDDLVRQTKEQVGAFPGKWEPLDGRQVKMIWVHPLDSDQFGSEARWRLVKSIFRKVDAGPPNQSTEIAGVVIILTRQTEAWPLQRCLTCSSGERDTCPTKRFGKAAGKTQQAVESAELGLPKSSALLE